MSAEPTIPWSNIQVPDYIEAVDQLYDDFHVGVVTLKTENYAMVSGRPLNFNIWQVKVHRSVGDRNPNE